MEEAISKLITDQFTLVEIQTLPASLIDDILHKLASLDIPILSVMLLLPPSTIPSSYQTTPHEARCTMKF